MWALHTLQLSVYLTLLCAALYVCSLSEQSHYFYVCIQLQFISCACYLPVLAFESGCALPFCRRCPPWLQLRRSPQQCFPGRFHWAPWATTVAALIMGVLLTLVPLCSRKGLTLAAIYAEWLDRPGIPKVWGALFAVTQILSLLHIYSFSTLKTFV